MKKTSKLFGAVALSAALALGTAVPAFAVEASDTTIADENLGTAQTDEDGKQVFNPANGTKVNIQSQTLQINVTIPLAMTVNTLTTGGKVGVPTNYVIKSNTEAPVYITKIGAAYSTTNSKGKSWMMVGDDVTASGYTTKATGASAYGDMNLTMQPAGAEAPIAIVPSATTTGSTPTAIYTASEENPSTMEIAEATADAAQEITVEFAGNSTPMLKDYTSSDKTAGVEAFTLTYTVSLFNNKAA